MSGVSTCFTRFSVFNMHYSGFSVECNNESLVTMLKILSKNRFVLKICHRVYRIKLMILYSCLFLQMLMSFVFLRHGSTLVLVTEVTLYGDVSRIDLELILVYISGPRCNVEQSGANHVWELAINIVQ